MDRYNPKGQGNILLESLKAQRLTPLEFQRKVAKWLLDPEVWGTFKPKQFPIKTQQIKEHENMMPSRKKELSKSYYLENPEIGHYYDTTLSTFYANVQRVHDIVEFMDAIDNGEEYEKLKVRKKEFDSVISRQGMELRVKSYDKRVQEVEKEGE